MKLEEALQFADQWTEGQTFYEGAQGWRVVCAVLAAEVRRLRAELVQCETQHASTEDGYCDWVCPTPTGYLMQCCDCGLTHEVDFRVAKYEPRPSEEFSVVEDENLQVQFRMRRFSQADNILFKVEE